MITKTSSSVIVDTAEWFWTQFFLDQGTIKNALFNPTIRGSSSSVKVLLHTRLKFNDFLNASLPPGVDIR